MDLNINILDRNSLKIISLEGHFTDDKVPLYLDAINPVFNSECKVIAVDLNKIDYIDSSGIHGLISSMKNAKNENKEFILYDINDKIFKFFEDVGLRDYFTTMSKEEFENKYK